MTAGNVKADKKLTELKRSERYFVLRKVKIGSEILTCIKYNFARRQQ
jgi:hypothetical protein